MAPLDCTSNLEKICEVKFRVSRCQELATKSCILIVLSLSKVLNCECLLVATFSGVISSILRRGETK